MAKPWILSRHTGDSLHDVFWGFLLSTCAEWGWHEFEFFVEMGFQTTVSCPQSEDCRLLPSIKFVVGIFGGRCRAEWEHLVNACMCDD